MAYNYNYVDRRSRLQKIRDKIVPMYPDSHRIFGTFEEFNYEGTGRRGSWRWDVRTVAVGYSVTTRAEQRDQGMVCEGWHLTLHIGPITVELHGSDREETDD